MTQTGYFMPMKPKKAVHVQINQSHEKALKQSFTNYRICDRRVSMTTPTSGATLRISEYFRKRS